MPQEYDAIVLSPSVGTKNAAFQSSATADNYNLIQASTLDASDALNQAFNVGTTVHITGGTYITLKPLDLKANNVIVGIGRESVTIQPGSAFSGTAVMRYASTLLAGNGSANISLSGFTIDGTNLASAASVAGLYGVASNAKLSGITIKNMPLQGINVDFGWNRASVSLIACDYGVVADDVVLANNGRDGTQASWTGGLYNSVIGNIVIATGSGGAFAAMDVGPVANTRIERSRVVDGVHRGLRVLGGTGTVSVSVYISQNIIADNGNDGIAVHQVAQGLHVLDNVAKGNTGHGISIGSGTYAVGGAVITGNYSVNNGADGINLAGNGTHILLVNNINVNESTGTNQNTGVSIGGEVTQVIAINNIALNNSATAMINSSTGTIALTGTNLGSGA